MNAKEQIKKHRLPCGPMSVSIEGVCRRRLKDHYDMLLDRLTQETHPQGVDEEILAMEEQVEIPEPEEPKEPEETSEEKKKRLIEEGKMKADVKKEVRKYEEKIMPKPKPKAKAKTSDHSEPDEEEEELQGNSKLLQNITGKIHKR
jgi:hypothetical protein